MYMCVGECASKCGCLWRPEALDLEAGVTSGYEHS